ncbi:MAG: ArsR family transcriptional regulator [Terriglobia bacterium]
MKETLTIEIRPLEKMLSGFSDTFKAVQGGRKVTPRRGAYFTSIEAARHFLTPERLALLRVIRESRPGSVYELAKMTGRNLKTIQTDLKILKKHGLVRFREVQGAAHRTAKAPVAPYREIALKIAI